MTCFEEVEFKVAAKTARLIGRESISSAEGAIIELVKNSYDADAKHCSVYILSKYDGVPKTLSATDFEDAQEVSRDKEQLLSECYEQVALDGSYILIKGLSKSDLSDLQNVFSSYNSIIIADDGEGMDGQTIKDHWMTIGTNAKELSVVSEDGRVKSGAKGIGRFALDKLGSRCDLYTKRANGEGCNWKVNWEDFEESETLNEVTASLEIKELSFLKTIERIIKNDGAIYSESTKSGTIIHVSHLREFWPKGRIQKLYENLKSLLPPVEETNFKVSLFANAYPDDFGLLSSSDYDEYDWKLSASVKNGRASLLFSPAEYDMGSFDEDFFNSPLYLNEPLFTEEDFRSGSYSLDLDILKLLPSSDSEDLARNLQNIGEFDFSIYFMKRGQTAEDKNKYHYRDFNLALRKQWFDQNGGVKIYRDKMRIRPYGIGPHFDWLGLDKRAAESPAAPIRKGQWRVRAHQIAGVANISRINNPLIQDQANREGLQDNQTLETLKNLLVSLIKQLEYHRSYVAYILDNLYSKKNKEAAVVKRTDEIINRYAKREQKPDLFEPGQSAEDESDFESLVKRAKIQNKAIDDLKQQNKLLRVLASSGAMISSFAHDFKKISNTLSSRHLELIQLLKMHDIELCGVDDALNPFLMIEEMEKQDSKLNSWLVLTLDTLKQDRRKSKNVNLKDYFSTLRGFWRTHLSYRNASLNITVSEDIFLKCFEIDLDSIFNNLISNSYEAFKRTGFRGDKDITITVTKDTTGIIFNYVDTGPGLSENIVNKNSIFEPLFTTKTDSEGTPTGTGLGLALVKGSVEDLHGTLMLRSEPGQTGFNLDIQIPVRGS